MRPWSEATGPPSQETRSEPTEEETGSHELAVETRTHFRCTCGEKFPTGAQFDYHVKAFGGRR